MTSKLLSPETSLLLIVDVQEKLVAAVEKGNKVAKNATKLAKAAGILNVATLISEQYPKGLGYSVEELKEGLSTDAKIIEKTVFSCLKQGAFLNALKETGKKQVILCGIETHVCVHQTANELLQEGYEVHIVKDACGSRNKLEYETGIERMVNDGCIPTCTETVIFELLKGAKHPEFKEVQALIK